MLLVCIVIFDEIFTIVFNFLFSNTLFKKSNPFRLFSFSFSLSDRNTRSLSNYWSHKVTVSFIFLLYHKKITFINLSCLLN